MGIMDMDISTSLKINAMIFLLPASYLVCVYPFRLTEKFSYDRRFTYFLYVAGPLGTIALALLLLPRFIGKKPPVILEIVIAVLWSLLALIAGINVMRGRTSFMYNVALHALQENDVIKYTTGGLFLVVGVLLAFDGLLLVIGRRKEATRRGREGEVEKAATEDNPE